MVFGICGVRCVVPYVSAYEHPSLTVSDNDLWSNLTVLMVGFHGLFLEKQCLIKSFILHAESKRGTGWRENIYTKYDTKSMIMI